MTTPSDDSVAVIGIFDNDRLYLYDAAEFRPARDGEVWEYCGAHFVSTVEKKPWMKCRVRVLTRLDPSTVSAAHNANRYWPGDEAMVQRELDATADAFLAGAR